MDVIFLPRCAPEERDVCCAPEERDVYSLTYHELCAPAERHVIAGGSIYIPLLTERCT